MWTVTDLFLKANKIQFLSDIDGNKYIDMLVSVDDKLYASYQVSDGNTVSFQSVDLNISTKGVTKLYATSINSDGYTDIVTISPGNIVFYKGEPDSAFSNIKSIATTSDKVTLRDINYDGIADLFIIDSGKLSVFVSKSNGQNSPDYVEMSLEINVKSILFFDADGDCITDLFLMDANNQYTIYSIKHDQGITFSDTFAEISRSTVDNICEIIGISDFDRNGSLDILYHDCTNLKLLKNDLPDSTTCQLGTASFTPTSLTITGTESLLKDGNNICFGDFNSDSFIDIFYLNRNVIYVLENKSNLKFNHYKIELDGSKTIDQFSCFDYNHNGFFNLLAVSSTEMYVLQNKVNGHNYFLKLSALIDCEDCGDRLPPSRDANFKFYLSDEYGNPHGMALSHSNVHLSLPYEWIGLGSITNYIPQLSITTYESITQDGIIPNSHLYFFSNQILLYMKMGDAFTVIAVLVASSVILIGVVIWMQRKENKYDLKVRMESTNRVLLRGL
eukprot:NODE_208_length_14728_cov_0.400164.p2 type:complete len:502 gc:universal NODE_208_length_14728_cov_0.400164:2301-796(-)